MRTRTEEHQFLTMNIKCRLYYNMLYNIIGMEL